MSRVAKASDYRRAISRSKEWPLHIREIAWQNLPILGSGRINPRMSMINIAGINGTGKSKLLAAFSVAISDEYKYAPELDDFTTGCISVHLETKSSHIIYNYNFNRKERQIFYDPAFDLEPLKLYRLDVPENVISARRHFRDVNDAEILTNGIPEYELSTPDLADVNSITKKNYDSVRRFITDEGMHFFSVSQSGKSYNSLSMGLGELSALTIWSLLKEADSRTILALEEPECFLSPSARSALGDFLVKETVIKKHIILTSTHSSDIVLSAGLAGAVPVYLANDGLRTCSNSEMPELLEQIGHSYRKDRIIYVEDHLAKAFLSVLIMIHAPSWIRSVEIVPLTGFGDLVKLSHILVGREGAIKSILAFDYDKKLSTELRSVEPNMLCFIPSRGGIEIELIETIETYIDEIESYFPHYAIRFNITLKKGNNPHDIITDITQGANISLTELCFKIHEFWIRKYWNADTAEDFQLLKSRLYPNEA